MRHGIWLVTGFAVAACGPRYRKEVVGSSSARIAASVDACPEPCRRVEAAAEVSAAPGGTGIAIGEAGLHQAQLSIALPRAMEVRYRLACPGSSSEGVVGETYEAYRNRRLAELQRQREQKKQAIGAVAGAVLGSAGAGATVESPNGSATVEGEVSGEALGEAAAEQALAQPELPAWDTGARTIDQKLTLDIPETGVCSLILAAVDDSADASGLSGSVSLTHLVDIKAEKRAHQAETNRRAVVIRGDLHASLVAAGADPEKRARERAAAEAERLRIEAERRQRELALRAEADAERRTRDAERQARARAKLEAEWKIQAELEADVRVAMQTRERVIAYLGECGGDRYRRQREEQARRERGRVIIRVSLDARARLVARLEGLGADRGYRARLDAERMREFEARDAARRERMRRRQLRIDAAHAVRAEIVADLEANGAVIGGRFGGDPVADDTPFEVSAPPATVEVEVESSHPPPTGVGIGVGVDLGGVSVGGSGGVSVGGSAGGTVVVKPRPTSRPKRSRPKPRPTTHVPSKRPAPKPKAPVIRDHRRKADD